MSAIAKYVGVFLAWNLAASAAVVFAPPLVGMPVAVGLAWLVLYGYLLRGPRPPRRWALLRLRPLRGAALRWTLLAVPVVMLASWALGSVYLQLVPVPPESLNPFESMTRTAEGRLALTVLAVGLAPLLEELFFRGLVQRSLELRWGSARGIVGAAALFAAIHLQPWVLPLHLFLGLVFGFAVYATRSIWAGVVLHTANNIAAVVGMGMEPPADEAISTLWQTGVTTEWWISLGWLLLAILLLTRTARGLLDAGRTARLRDAVVER